MLGSWLGTLHVILMHSVSEAALGIRDSVKVSQQQTHESQDTTKTGYENTVAEGSYVKSEAET